MKIRGGRKKGALNITIENLLKREPYRTISLAICWITIKKTRCLGKIIGPTPKQIRMFLSTGIHEQDTLGEDLRMDHNATMAWLNRFRKFQPDSWADARNLSNKILDKKLHEMIKIGAIIRTESNYVLSEDYWQLREREEDSNFITKCSESQISPLVSILWDIYHPLGIIYGSSKKIILDKKASEDFIRLTKLIEKKLWGKRYNQYRSSNKVSVPQYRLVIRVGGNAFSRNNPYPWLKETIPGPDTDTL